MIYFATSLHDYMDNSVYIIRFTEQKGTQTFKIEKPVSDSIYRKRDCIKNAFEIDCKCILKWKILKNKFELKAYQIFDNKQSEWNLYCEESLNIKYILPMCYPYKLITVDTPLTLNNPKDDTKFERNDISPSDSCLCFIKNNLFLYEFCFSQNLKLKNIEDLILQLKLHPNFLE